MKFLLTCQMAGSSRHGMVRRVYALSKALVEQGHDVTILASSYSHTRKAQPQRARFRTPEEIDGIKYFWMPGIRYSFDSSVVRVISMFNYIAFCAAWIALNVRRGRFDCIIASSPFPTEIYPAALASRLAKGLLVFDVRDLWPLTLKKLGGYSARHPFIMLMQCAEDYACRNADLITTVLRNGERYLRSRGLAAGRYHHMPNGVVAAPVADKLDGNHRQLLDRLRDSDRFIIGYAGAIGLSNAMDCLVQALPRVNDNVHLVLAGSGERVDSVRQLADELKVSKRVHLIGRIGPGQVPDLLSRVDAGFVATRKSSLYRYGASLTKAGEYALAGLPQIYGVGDRGNPVELSGGGVQFVPESAGSCAEAITVLYGMNETQRRQMGLRGQTWILENQLWSRLAQAFVNRLEDCRDSNRQSAAP